MDDCYSLRFPDGSHDRLPDSGAVYEARDMLAHEERCVACVAEVVRDEVAGQPDSSHETEHCRRDWFGAVGPDNWCKRLGLAWHCPSRHHQNRRNGSCSQAIRIVPTRRHKRPEQPLGAAPGRRS